MRALTLVDKMPFGHFRNQQFKDIDKRYLFALYSFIVNVHFTNRTEQGTFVAGFVETYKDYLKEKGFMQYNIRKTKLIEYAIEDTFKYTNKEAPKGGFFYE